MLVIATVLFYIHLGDVSNFFIVKTDTLLGINFLGGKNEVSGILISAFFIFFINLLISATLYKRDNLLAKLVPFFTLFFSLLILISVGVIVATN